MRAAASGAVGATLLVLLGLVPSVGAQDGAEESSDRYATKWVSILSAYPSFAEAKADALKLAKKSGLPFTMEGTVYDKKKGLIYGGKPGDDPLAGEPVYARRYNQTLIDGKETGYLSVEYSNTYDGFKPGYYLVVAGVFDSAKAAEAQTKRFSSWAPTAYVKKSKLYMGCLL